jgi:hypothetical protein
LIKQRKISKKKFKRMKVLTFKNRCLKNVGIGFKNIRPIMLTSLLMILKATMKGSMLKRLYHLRRKKPKN